MPELPAILTAGGVYGILAFVIVYLISGNIKDRRDYRTQYASLLKRLTDANAREEKAREEYDALLKAKREGEETYIQRIRTLEQENFVLRQGGGAGGHSP
jgi:hypothetical protein